MPLVCLIGFLVYYYGTLYQLTYDFYSLFENSLLNVYSTQLVKVVMVTNIEKASRGVLEIVVAAFIYTQL